MPLENENDPVPETETVKRKAGRPKGAKNKGGRPKDTGIALKQQRRYEITLQEAVRQGVHPDLIIQFWKIILTGKTPILISENGIDYMIPDPNPLASVPTLADRMAATRALSERGWGLPSQNVDIDIKTRAELQLTGITEAQLEAWNLKNLQALREMLKIPDPQDVVDAELVEINENSPLLPENTGNDAGDSSE